MYARHSTALAAVLAAAAWMLPVTTGIAGAQPVPIAAAQAPSWPESPVHAKWQQLGGAAFAGDLVGEEVVQADGIRHAKFSKDVRITWQEGAGAHWFSGRVARAWERKLKPDGTTDNVAIMDQVHLTGRFEEGPASAFSTGYSVYGSYAISGAIRQKFWEYGGIDSIFGWPSIEEIVENDGSRQAFSQRVILYQKRGEPAYWISGALRQKYWDKGGPWSDELGWLAGDQTAAPGNGWTVRFEKGRTMYWSPSTPASIPHGPIETWWLAEGGLTGRMGYPSGDTVDLGNGHMSAFSTGYSVYWSAATGPHWLGGALSGKLLTIDGVHGSLGYPTSDEHPTAAAGPDGVYAQFGPTKVILASQFGEFVVQDQFLAKLRADGDVARYGMPQIDDRPLDDVHRFQQFLEATIFDGGGRPAVTLGWGFRSAWWASGGTSSPLGLPKSDYVAEGAGYAQAFDHGSISCDRSLANCVVR